MVIEISKNENQPLPKGFKVAYCYRVDGDVACCKHEALPLFSSFFWRNQIFFPPYVA